MKNTLFLLTFSTLTLSLFANTYNDNYYIGFIDTLGIDTHVTDDGGDCTQPASKAIYQFRNTLLNGQKDSEIYLHAVVDIIDRLKFEISPLCRTFFGDFHDFMTAYYGDTEEIKSTAERVYKYHYQLIDGAIEGSREAIDTGDDYEAGRAHASILRQFIDLEKSGLPITTITQSVQEAAVHGSGDQLGLVKTTMVQVEEIVISVELSDEEEFKEGDVQVGAQELTAPEPQQDGQYDVYGFDEGTEEEQQPEQIYQEQAQQIADEIFAQQINYDLDEFKNDETEYDTAGEVENALVMNISDQEVTTLGVFVDMSYYIEDDSTEKTELADELVVNVYLDEELTNDEKSFAVQSSLSTPEAIEEIDQYSTDGGIGDGDNYVSDYDYDYDYEGQVIQRRMLSEIQQGFESDYDL